MLLVYMHRYEFIGCELWIITPQLFGAVHAVNLSGVGLLTSLFFTLDTILINMSKT